MSMCWSRRDSRVELEEYSATALNELRALKQGKTETMPALDYILEWLNRLAQGAAVSDVLEGLLFWEVLKAWRPDSEYGSMRDVNKLLPVARELHSRFKRLATEPVQCSEADMDDGRRFLIELCRRCIAESSRSVGDAGRALRLVG